MKNKRVNNMYQYRQTTNYTCGAASLMTALHSVGILSDKQMIRRTELKLSKELGTCPRKGVTPNQVRRWLSLSAQSWYNSSEESRAPVNQDCEQSSSFLLRIPKLILLHDGDEFHWSVLKEVRNKHIILVDPWIPNEALKMSHIKAAKSIIEVL